MMMQLTHAVLLYADMKLSLPLVAIACTLGSTTAFVPAASHRLNAALTQQQPRTVTREVSTFVTGVH